MDTENGGAKEQTELNAYGIGLLSCRLRLLRRPGEIQKDQAPGEGGGTAAGSLVT